MRLGQTGLIFSVLFCKSDPHAVIPNTEIGRLQLYLEYSDLINPHTNMIQINISPKHFAICDHKSDETRSVTHVNKAYLV